MNELKESVEHGRRSTYINYKCRCELCRSANAKYQREQRIVATWDDNIWGAVVDTCFAEGYGKDVPILKLDGFDKPVTAKMVYEAVLQCEQLIKTNIIRLLGA